VPCDQSQPISAIDCSLLLATKSPSQHSPSQHILQWTSGLLHTTSGVIMTSQNMGGERVSTKNGCALELQLFNGKNCSEHLGNSDNYHAQGHALISRRTVDSSSVDHTVRCSANSLCTPHSIEDILSRPRRVHVTSLLLPESRRTSGPVVQGGLDTWSMRSSDEVQRLGQRTGDDDLPWKSMYWSQHSPATQVRLSATTSTRQGMKELS